LIPLKPAVAFIIGQSLALGLVGALLVVPGTAVFLDVFGAESLPYVYLIVAALGAAVSFSLTMLQSRFGLFQLAIGSTLAAGAAIAACWWILFVAGEAWIAYGVLVLFPLEIQLGFVFIGAQAGRAFDVQELKRVFSRIVAGFVFGFMVGGFAAGAFTGQGWNAIHLLLASAGMAIVMALLMLGTRRYVPEPIEEGGDPIPEAKPASFRRILGSPLIRAVFAYQMLSAIGTQLLEYLVYDRAAARFSGTQELASFMGGYSALLNLVDLVVLVALGGFLMSRYGLRFGLAANPAVVTGFVAAAVVVALVSGPDATLFFVLVAVARIADITLTDATARTSVNATFKALPIGQRLSAQVSVEGAGVPLALGLTAVLILAINALPGSTVTEVTAAAVVLGVLWTISAWVVYRRYQAAVVAAARRRTLDGEIVDLDEPVTRTALRSLLASADPRDVALGATLLAGPSDPDTIRLVAAAAANAPLEGQRALLGHVVAGSPELARRIATACLRSGRSDYALDGLRALGRIGGPVDLALIKSFFGHTDLRLRAGAIGVVLRKAADQPGVLGLMTSAAASPAPADRRFAAMAIAEAGRTPSPELLAALLGDGDELVREEAAAAVAALNDNQRRALLRMRMAARDKIRFIRAARPGASAAFCDAVVEELARDEAVRPELVRLLGAGGWRATSERRAVIDRLVQREVDRIAAARDWAERLGGGELNSAASVRLRRALAQEARQSGRQLIDLLGLLHDRHLIVRVSRVLEDLTPGDKGLAIESLDLLLGPEHRAMIVAALNTVFARDKSEIQARKSRAAAGIADTLRALAADCSWALQGDWLLACTIATMREGGLSASELAAIRPLGPASAELIRLAQQ
jgi:hypothetical protein